MYLAIASAACAGAIPTHFVKGGGGLSNAEGQRGRGCGKAAGSNDNAGGYQLGVGGSLSASQLVAVGRSSSHTLQSPAGLVHWSAAGHRHGARSGHSSGVGGHRVGTVWLAANLWWKSIQSTWGWEGGGGRKAGRICRPTSIGCALSGAPPHFQELPQSLVLGRLSLCAARLDHPIEKITSWFREELGDCYSLSVDSKCKKINEW